MNFKRFWSIAIITLLMASSIFLLENEDVSSEAPNGSSADGFCDDFESYPVGTYPTTWVKDANAHDLAKNYVDGAFSYSGSKSLRLYGYIGGCWAALTYHGLGTTSPFVIEVAIMNNNDNLYGCHPGRAKISLREGTSWTGHERFILYHRGTGEVVSGTGASLGTYVPLTWNKWTISYERMPDSKVRIQYWLNGEHKLTENLPEFWFEGSLNNLELSVDEGTAWFDDICVRHGNAYFEVNGYVYRYGSIDGISGAKVYSDSGLSTTTDQDGYYTLGLQNGDHLITVEAEGYIDHEEQITVSDTEISLDFYLLDDNVCFNMPYYFQDQTQWCTLYTMSMVLEYYGNDIKPWEIADEWDMNYNDGIQYENWNYVEHDVIGYLEESDIIEDHKYLTSSDYMSKELQSWILTNLYLGRPIIFVYSFTVNIIDFSNHQIIINGYKMIDSNLYLSVTDSSGTFINNKCKLDKNPPFINIDVPISFFNPESFNYCSYYALNSIPDEQLITYSPRTYRSMILRQNNEDVYYLFVNNGLTWTDQYTEDLGDLNINPYDYEPQPSIFGNAELRIENLMLMNNDKNTKYSMDNSYLIEREGGDSGEGSGEWYLTDTITYTLSAHSSLDISSQDVMNCVDLSNLQSGSYSYKIIAHDSDTGHYEILSDINFKVITLGEAIETLIGMVKEIGLNKGTEKNMVSILENTLKSINADNSHIRNDAANKINAFINMVKTKSGKINGISQEQAEELTEYAERIKANL